MNRKWLSCFLIVCLLSGGLSQPLLSIAVSHQSEETTSSAPVAGELPTLSSEVLGTPTEIEPGTLEEVPEKEKSIQEYVAEETYEARDLSKEDPNNVSHPVVTVQITGQTLEGEIGLRSEPALTSKTILEKLSLQAKGEGTDWQEVKTFAESEQHDLTDTSIPFEYKNLSEDQSYRLVADYVIEESNEEGDIARTHHKGQVLIGKIEPTQKPPEPESNDSSLAPLKFADAEVETIGRTSDSVPIGPRAVADVYYQGNYHNKVYAYTTIKNITNKDATIQILLHGYSELPHFVVWSTDPNRIKNLCANVSSVSSGIPSNLWSTLKSEGTNVALPLDRTIITNSFVDKSALMGPAQMTNLKPQTTYYVWVFDILRSNGNARFAHPQGTSTADTKGIHSPYVFKTDTAMALNLTAPTFTQGSASATSIPMVGKTYTGDIFQTSGQGKVQVTSNDETTVQDKVTNLGHTITQGGSYNGTTVPGLTAGTRYKGRVAIKDFGGTWKYSPWSGYFYTANSVNQPTISSQTAPTNSNNAAAQVSATYGAGDVAAHPTAAEVQISTNNSTFTTINTTTTPATTNPTINTGNKSVSFSLSKLNATTTYYVRYRVRNASNVWSGYSTSRGFTTGSVALTLNTPTFTQTTATPTAIYMTGATYTGDIFQTSGQGKVQVTSDDGTTVQDKITNLTHTVSRGGSYHNITVPNLVAGTRYRGRVAIKDYGGNWRYSGWSGYFYTVNTVNQPAVPTLNTPTAANNATATVSATYNVGNVAAHPTAVHVEISTDGSSWSTPSNSTTPATTTPTIDTGTKSVNFTLSKLNSKTKYYVRYRVRNASNVWSGLSTSREFTTKGVPLVISPPVFDQTTATATSIQLKPGTYTGDISPTANQGVVFTESYNSGTNDKDWTARVHNLQHTTTTNGTYSAATVTGLTPGTRYRGWIQIKNAEEVFVGPVGQPSGAANEYFYTKNTVSSLSAPTLNTPVTENGATAEFSMDYQAAGDHPDQPAAHPSNVKIYLSTDGVSYSELTSSSGNPAVEEVTIDTSTKKASVKIKNLNADQTYYVKCSVVNQGGESEQTPVRTFVTNPRQAGFYVSETPTFNFGVQSVSTNATTAGLTDHQGTNDFGIRMENVGMNANWSFSARLSSLQTQDGSNRQLTGAQVSFNKELQRTTDGVNWQPVIQDFEGLTTPATVLSADNSTQQLWKSTSVAAGQGKFRTTIEFDSVRLLLPGNVAQKEDYYEGRIEWLMVNEP